GVVGRPALERPGEGKGVRRLDDLLGADGDGYSTGGGVCGAVDCNDGNATVNPGAPEIPGNGVDDDCNAGTPGGCPPQPQSAEAAAVGGGAGERASDLAFYVLPLLALVLGMRRRR
ncbi:MAG: putative metal-binding motif-containing protein, partial [Candidatus Methylomirabilis sp.]|nr:putative metal-binding motif-containing protein [Deltaproteobacteria bacterium]